jgi:transposase
MFYRQNLQSYSEHRMKKAISFATVLNYGGNKTKKYAHIIQLVINVDNGPQLASNRTEFIRRMIEFSKKAGIEIRLVYSPPYHSKYNPIERYCGILETHWNGKLLDSISKAVVDL